MVVLGSCTFTTSTSQLSLETLCLVQKAVLSIAVHGLGLLVVFQSVHLPLFQKRDAVLYVESLIESIMGGLEGLINILDSEGGFGALENQLLPEQAASYLNHASRVSIASYKSPKGTAGFPLPGHESFPENNSSIKMLEAAMQ
ncbi:protein NAP1-like, partial [Trifolium medium]|nr:protein NAP1-like [Trifolium medium]